MDSLSQKGYSQENSAESLCLADADRNHDAHHRDNHSAVELKESGPALMRTPKGMRMTIGLFGRRNVGKSSVLNALTHQQTSIVSHVAGTTTDPVDKPMELLPLGPVLFVDTAGIDDTQEDIGALRTQRTAQVFDRCDVGVLVSEAGVWGSYEDGIVEQFAKRAIPFIIVFNKVDLLDRENRNNVRADTDDADDVSSVDASPSMACAATAEHTECYAPHEVLSWCRSCVPQSLRDIPAVVMSASQGWGVLELRQALLDNAPDEFVNDPTILGDIVPAGATVILVIPIDKEAPKGRLILPQVQVIRDLLDAGCAAYTVRDTELLQALASLSNPPALVVTDSQAFAEVSQIVPESIPLTGFSVAFARFKGDLPTQALGALAIDELTEQSRVLVAEACTHHPIEEDIGTVKIPRLLRAHVGQKLQIDHVRGKDFPENLSSYDLVIHCGGCMFNRRTMLSRIEACLAAGVPITNYGLTLAYLNGVFERSIKAFPGIAQLVEERRCAEKHTEVYTKERKAEA